MENSLNLILLVMGGNSLVFEAYDFVALMRLRMFFIVFFFQQIKHNNFDYGVYFLKIYTLFFIYIQEIFIFL